MKERRNKQGLFPLRETRQGWLDWKGQVGQIGQNVRLRANAEGEQVGYASRKWLVSVLGGGSAH